MAGSLGATQLGSLEELPTSALVLLKCLFHFQPHYTLSTGVVGRQALDDPVVAFSKWVPPLSSHNTPTRGQSPLRRAVCPPNSSGVGGEAAVTGGSPAGVPCP